MTLLYRRTNEPVDIYGVTMDSHGYAQFLVRDNTQWRWVSAKHFEPLHTSAYMPVGPGNAFCVKVGDFTG